MVKSEYINKMYFSVKYVSQQWLVNTVSATKHLLFAKGVLHTYKLINFTYTNMYANIQTQND